MPYDELEGLVLDLEGEVADRAPSRDVAEALDCLLSLVSKLIAHTDLPESREVKRDFGDAVELVRRLRR